VLTTRLRTLSLLTLLLAAPALAQDLPLHTVAEKSDFQTTSRHADVVAYCEQLAKQSPLVRLGQLGTSHEGRKLPLVIVADPPVETPEQAAQSGKLVVFAMGNIHAGEVDGKEALLMFLRDLATGPDRGLLKQLVFVCAPIFNADGNERISKENRRSQAGPAEGVGVRANAQGFDLNRDFVKLESPEVRALVRLFTKWDPAAFIDCHTTNGSYHRYTITYEGGRSLAGDAKLVSFLRDTLLPDVTRRLEQETKYKSYFYGNFTPDRKGWETVPATPRYGIHYMGLRNRIAILSESYTYAPFKDRILATRGFVRAICEYLAEHKDQVRKLLDDARSATANAKPGTPLVLREKPVPLPRPHQLLGYVEEQRNGRRRPTDQPKEYEVQYYGAGEPTLTVDRPYAYLFPAALARVLENLQRHGIDVDELREDVELDVEAYRVDKVRRLPAFQQHQPVAVEVTPRKESRQVAAGTILVRTAQPLGALAAYLLEPQSPDGLGTWNFFDPQLKEGGDYPVLRLPAAAPVHTTRVRALPEDRTFNKTITRGRPLPNFTGDPIAIAAWLDEEHYLEPRGGRLYKVHARTGRAEPFLDPARLAKGLRTLPGVSAETAESLANQTSFRMNPQKTGFLFTQDGELCVCNFDGTGAVQLTKSKGSKELETFSPDGKHVAFVRDQNLCVVDLATQTEKALTADGGGPIFNGKADWVYFEELFDRHYQAYWWSPDARFLAFLRLDDKPVHGFTVVDHIPVRLNIEVTPYPKAGDPNPVARLGIVSVTGGPVQWVDLSGYPANDVLIPRAGFTPDGGKAYFYVQDRAQTWLDVCTVPTAGGSPAKLFREKTKAWVEDLGPLTFLKDGSFLFPSERSGYKHFYHYDPAGKLLTAVTSGDGEARKLHAVEEAGGWVYYSGTLASSLSLNAYRSKLDGSRTERLTDRPGEHTVQFSPNGSLFVDSWSDHETPPRVVLRDAKGDRVRTLDTNPVYVRQEYRLGKYELVQIKTPDGFTLEGSLLFPADFDEAKKYPVWFKTYGGPHTPTVHDSFGNSQLQDHAQASLGFVIFRADPRSASGKGAVSAWSAYRQLGVQELQDVETAIKWLHHFPWVDRDRIGMSGHSYGGFLTAYCLTHSKLFAAGIAGAPVTDWRNYDTIYTERYMDTPQKNPQGYDVTSVVKAAKDLHGQLLLLHGIMDDNVHLQNSVQLIGALQEANKQFEVMFYPRARHGIFGQHYQNLVVNFMVRALRPEKGAGRPAEVPAKPVAK
jgi:dipeptidyl-peptidase 4